MSPPSNLLNFDVSTGLKSVLGSELITDDQVAIFELVKNSFDAGANDVQIYFGADEITVVDDGSGMSSDDLQKKWLFVAYSEKRVPKESIGFRESIAERQHYAGSKGIGRFSTDRLGRYLYLQTRTVNESTELVHKLNIDWHLFDQDYFQHFEKVKVQYSSSASGFEMPPRVKRIKNGTVIKITGLKKDWAREEILRLKSALAKLINPFGAETDNFRISIIAPSEDSADEETLKKVENAEGSTSAPVVPANAIVNGEVGNFIFKTLEEKTTYTEVSVSSDGYLISKLVDRGELIYQIREQNEYNLLNASGFRCQLFFLNSSAKLTFARRMGVPSVQFGSVFLFRNGFRVFPIGEQDDDWFGMDRRKQQGYARFLGTRDVIGRIDVFGDGDAFQEASSRNTGLIETESTIQLRKCFFDYCLKRLERYVVPVTFVDKEDKNTSDLSRLKTDPGKARVTEVVGKLAGNPAVELLDYSENLVALIDEKSSEFEGSLAGLRAVAENTKDKSLYQRIEEAERKFKRLRKSELAAQAQADAERDAREKAETRAERAEAATAKAVKKFEEEKKRSLFLTSVSSLDKDTILNLHHQITIYVVNIQQEIENLMHDLNDTTNDLNKVELIDVLGRISFLNRKVMNVSKFATRANFRLESETISADLADYIEEYIGGVVQDFLVGRMSVSVVNEAASFEHRFKPIDIAVVVDNLIANARKAKAREVVFEMRTRHKNTLEICVEDDGRGIRLDEDDFGRIFDKGFTTTDGSGLGLYHVSQVLGEMSGTISASRGSNGNGARFLIKISR